MKPKFFLGIDVGKFRHQAAVIDRDGASVGRSLAFENSASGFERLFRFTKAVGRPKQFLAGMESTGHYWLNLYYALKEQGVKAVVINPISTAHISQGHIRKTKTDKIDARTIAEQIRVGHFKASIVPDENAFRLRQLTRLRWKLSSYVSILKNRFVACLDRYFPEFDGVFKSIWLKTPRKILEVAPLPCDILEIEPGELTRILCTASRGKFGHEHASRLISAAEKSVGIKYALDAARIEIDFLRSLINEIEATMKALEKDIKDALAKREQFLTTITGINELLAATILGEIGDIGYFDSPKSLVAFAGLDPSTFQTGTFEATRNRISKRGNAYLRRALWLAAGAASQRNLAIRPFYLKHRKNGRHHFHAVTAVARKLTHVVWRILKDNRPFDPTRLA